MDPEKSIPRVDKPPVGYAWVKSVPFSDWINPGDLLAGLFLLFVLGVFTCCNPYTAPGRPRATLWSEDNAAYRVRCTSAECGNFGNVAGQRTAESATLAPRSGRRNHSHCQQRYGACNTCYGNRDRCVGDSALICSTSVPLPSSCLTKASKCLKIHRSRSRRVHHRKYLLQVLVLPRPYDSKRFE